jgi:ribonuclease E
VRIYLLADDTLVPPAYRVEALRDLPPGEAVIAVAARSEREEAGKEIEEELSEPIEEETEAEAEPIAASRRPGRADASAEEESSDEENADDKRRRRRRGRRGGRRRGRGGRRDEGDMPVSAHRDNGGAMPEDSGTEGGESPQNTAAVSINVQEESFVPAMAPHISSQATENETEESPSNEDGSDEDKGTRRRGWWRRLVE